MCFLITPILYTQRCVVCNRFIIYTTFSCCFGRSWSLGLNYYTDPNHSTNPNRHSNRNTNPTLHDCRCFRIANLLMRGHVHTSTNHSVVYIILMFLKSLFYSKSFAFFHIFIACGQVTFVVLLMITLMYIYCYLTSVI